MTKPQLHHCLRYRDADRALAFLQALGFTERLVVRDPGDPSVVVHAQVQWRDNGGVMLGSARRDDKAEYLEPGRGVCNLVVASDEEVDATVARAVAAGGTLVAEPSHPPHGGRTAGVLDHEGNYWNIDSYEGE